MLTAVACPGMARAPRSAAGSSPAAATASNRATDPDNELDPCSGYTFDGVSLGMPRSRVAGVVSIAPVPASQSLVAGFEESTFQFRAVRPGRADEVQVGFEPRVKDPRVERLRARIHVSKIDPWPASLFGALGSPRQAIVDEWQWWSPSCGAALHLVKVGQLGSGESEPYILEIKRMATSNK